MFSYSRAASTTVPEQGLSSPGYSFPVSSGQEGQKSYGSPGSSSTKPDLLFCKTVTQHRPLPMPMPQAIAPTHLSPSLWLQMDSELYHWQAHGSFIVSCSAHLPVYSFGPVVLKHGGMRRLHDTAFPLSGQNCISLTFEVIWEEGRAEERWARFLNLLQPVSAFALEK